MVTVDLPGSSERCLEQITRQPESPPTLRNGFGGGGFDTGFLCVALAVCPITQSVEQAGLELTEILMPLPPEC